MSIVARDIHSRMHDRQIIAIGATMFALTSVAVFVFGYSPFNYIRRLFTAGFSKLHNYAYLDDIDSFVHFIDDIKRKHAKDHLPYLSEAINSKAGFPYPNTPLSIATINGSEHVFNYLIQNRNELGLNIDETDSYGISALHNACRYVLNRKKNISSKSGLSYIDDLVASGANPNSIEANSGSSPLHILASQYDMHDVTGNEEKKKLLGKVIGYLLDHGANINIKNSINGKTALHLVAEKGLIDIAQYLINQGSQVFIADSNNETPLHASLAALRPDLVMLLLHYDPHLVNVATTSDGFTPLHTALSVYVKSNTQVNVEKVISIARAIMSSSPDINQKDNRGNTPLTFLLSRASEYGYTVYGIEDVVLLIISQQGVNLNIQNHDRRNGLHYACSQKYLIKTAGILIDNGIDCSLRDRNGNTALHIACKNLFKEKSNDQLSGDSWKLLRTLVERIDNIASQNDNLETPLHLCVKYGNIGCLREIVKYMSESSVALQDSNGRNCLHLAVHREASEFGTSKLEMTKEILGGVNSITLLRDLLLKRDETDGNIPLHIAASIGGDNALKAIECLGDVALLEQIRTRNKRDETPIEIAWRYNKLDVVLFMIERYGIDSPFKLSGIMLSDDVYLTQILSYTTYKDTALIKSKILRRIISDSERNLQSNNLSLRKWEDTASELEIRNEITNSMKQSIYYTIQHRDSIRNANSGWSMNQERSSSSNINRGSRISSSSVSNTNANINSIDSEHCATSHNHQSNNPPVPPPVAEVIEASEGVNPSAIPLAEVVNDRGSHEQRR